MAIHTHNNNILMHFPPELAFKATKVKIAVAMECHFSSRNTKRNEKKIVNTIVLFFDFVRFEHFFLFIKSSVDFVLKAICSLYGLHWGQELSEVTSE